MSSAFLSVLYCSRAKDSDSLRSLYFYNYRYFKTPMDYLQKIVTSANLKQARADKTETIPFMSIVKKPEGCNRQGYNSIQRDRIIGIIRAAKDEIKKLYIGYDAKTREEREIIWEAVAEKRQQCIDAIDRMSESAYTMYLTLKEIDRKEYKDVARFIFEVLFGKPNEDKTYYFPALMAIEFDLDGEDNFVLTLSNAANPSDTAFTIADLLKETSDISRTVNSNWADLTDYSKHKDVINSLIEDPLNRALRTMQEGMSNQQFVVDSTGILGRRYTDDSQTSFQDKQVRLINNLLVFTDDNWKTVKTALGDIEGYGYGLAAEVIIGSFILGDNLQIGSESGKVNIDDTGIVVHDGAINIYNGDDRIFYVDDEGNLQIKGYATDGALADIKQEFTIFILFEIYGIDSAFNQGCAVTCAKDR